MKRLLVILAIILLSTTASATEQIPDVILIDGEVWVLDTPLMGYLDDTVQRQIHNQADKYYRYLSTDCRREYVAVWELKQGHVVLKSLYNPSIHEFDLSLFTPFLSEYIHNGEVWVDWIKNKGVIIQSKNSATADVRVLMFSEDTCGLSRVYTKNSLQEAKSAKSLYSEYVTDLLLCYDTEMPPGVYSVEVTRTVYNDVAAFIFVDAGDELKSIGRKHQIIRAIQTIINGMPWRWQSYLGPLYPIRKGDEIKFEIRDSIDITSMENLGFTL